MRDISIDAFLSAVHHLEAGDFPSEGMLQLLEETRIPSAELAPFLHFTPMGYTRNLIHRTNTLEILALCWSRDSATPIHDHAGQRCWVGVHDGAFTIDDYRHTSGLRAVGHATIEHLGTQTNVTTGMSDVREGYERDIHRVSIAPKCDRAVSIHIYAKPYTSCLIFNETTNRASVMPLYYDFEP